MTILTAEVTNQTEKFLHNLNPPWTRHGPGPARPLTGPREGRRLKAACFTF